MQSTNKSVDSNPKSTSVNDPNNNITPGVSSFNYLSRRERVIANDANISVEKFTMLKNDAVLQSKTDLVMDGCVQEVIKSRSCAKERKLVSSICNDMISDLK